MTAYAGLRALVIDDNAHMRVLLRALLHSIGINNVREAENGSVGFDLLCGNPADLILTDLAMKPMDGLQFTRRVRRDPESPNRQIPIIMITGFTEMSSILAARDTGVNEILAKPITIHSLASHVAEIIDRPRDFIRCEDYVGPDRRRRDDNARSLRRRSGDKDAIAI